MRPHSPCVKLKRKKKNPLFRTAFKNCVNLLPDDAGTPIPTPIANCMVLIVLPL